MEESWNKIIAMTLIIPTLITFYMLKESRKKKREVEEPEAGLTYNDTYCKPTLKALVYVQYLLVVSLFNYLVVIVLSALGSIDEDIFLRYRIIYVFIYLQYVR